MTVKNTNRLKTITKEKLLVLTSQVTGHTKVSETFAKIFSVYIQIHTYHKMSLYIAHIKDDMK